MQEQKNSSLSESKSVNNKSQDNEKLQQKKKQKAKEINGPKGLEPTRYGDWEKAGRCIDF